MKLMLEAKGMSQREFAKKIGIQEASLSRYIKGERLPKVTIGNKIAEELGCTLAYLLGDDANVNGYEEITVEDIYRIQCGLLIEICTNEQRENTALLIEGVTKMANALIRELEGKQV